jgi:hypothetical protein
MHAYVPSKPSYVTCYPDANQYHLSTPRDLFFSTSSCSQSCMLVLSLDRYTEANNTYRFVMFIPCMMGAYHHTDVIDTSFASTMFVCAFIVAYARKPAANTNTPS